jgi:YgiT-type zinc finger domain-containing protein
MSRPAKTDFCEYCSAPLDGGERLVTVHRHSKGRHFIFEQVPAQVCSRCGERYFKAAVVRQMDRQMKKPSSKAHTVAVPIITLRSAG